MLQPVPASACMVYLDDIVVHTSTYTAVLTNLCTVFELIARANLCLNPVKCSLFCRQTSFLVHRVQCPVCLPKLLLDGTGRRNASVTYPSPDNIWETGWLFATIPKEHLIMDHPPLTMSLWMVAFGVSDDPMTVL
ncbi:hypothetical protein AAFF_G00236640 [Aldrovandia affinis]|uniref:Reverse transcriptase domain-containing protein n=1 Tax=Aldrovandia affinis TaxID=143900 RepID=A0AAD7REC6_9TELE|nr:hypothetical protein AAFF_G00236640 [Aldrovandia affinis]